MIGFGMMIMPKKLLAWSLRNGYCFLYSSSLFSTLPQESLSGDGRGESSSSWHPLEAFFLLRGAE